MTTKNEKDDDKMTFDDYTRMGGNQPPVWPEIIVVFGIAMIIFATLSIFL